MAKEKRIIAEVCLDTETVPSSRLDVIASIAAKYGPKPGDEEKTAEKARQKALDEHRKTSLDGTFGELVCISWQVNDGPIQSSWRALDGNEGEMLSRFTFAMDDLANEVGADGIIYVAHNAEFDRKFLTKRMCVHRLDGPKGLAARGVKSWDSQWRCTMDTWMDEWKGRISLADLALALSLPVGKDDLPGSEVYDAMLRGEVARVVSHCERDVELVRAVWQRL